MGTAEGVYPKKFEDIQYASEANAFNTHGTGDGSDHADVATNTLKVTYDAQAEVAANTAKVGITSQQSTDITTNNAKVTYDDAAAVSSNTSFRTTPSTVITAGTNLTWDGNTLNATGGGGTTMNYVFKTTDESITFDDVLQNDNQLLFAVEANKEYVFTLFLHFSTDDDNDIKYTFTGPAASTGRSGIDIDTLTFTNPNAEPFGTEITIINNTGSRDENFAKIEGVLINGANAGNVQFQWAQGTDDAEATIVRAGSYIVWEDAS